MKNLFQTTLFRTKILSSCIIIIALLFAGLVAYLFAPKPHIESAAIKNVQPQKNPTPTQIKATPSPTSASVLGVNTYHPLPTATISIQPTSTPKNNPTITQAVNLQNNTTTTTSSNTITLTPTPTVQVTASVTVSPTQITDIVSLQIQTPGGTSNISVLLKDGADVCTVLQEAKDEGKVNSVTFDDSYMLSLHSNYVTEINGYKNNWTFTVNGTSPLGCSLLHPKPNDSIVWKFG